MQGLLVGCLAYNWRRLWQQWMWGLYLAWFEPWSPHSPLWYTWDPAHGRLGATSPWDLPSCLTSVDQTTARMLSLSRIATLLVLRIRPAAPSDGTYLARESENVWIATIMNVPISFICERSTSRVAGGHLLGRQKSTITISWYKECMKSHLPNHTRPVIKLDENSTFRDKSNLPCMCVCSTDNCRLCLTRLEVLNSWRYC